MSKVYLEDSTLTGIANAIRAKTGESGTITPANMATEIGDIPSGGTIESKTITANGTYTAPSGVDGYSPIVVNVPSSFPQATFSGDLSYLDYKGAYDWLFNNYGNYISTSNVTNCSYMFYYTESVEDLSNILLNFSSNINEINVSNAFNNCTHLKKLPSLNKTIQLTYTDYLFYECRWLREFGNDWNTKITLKSPTSSVTRTAMFYDCYSLREIPQWLDSFDNISKHSAPYQNMFNNCCSLDEISNLMPVTSIGPNANNNLNNMVKSCSRLKKFTFKTNNGTPYVREWSKAFLSLSDSIGYAASTVEERNILGYNSGIAPYVKKVTDAASYEALKNDPDWWTSDLAYSRYNYTSAVETINSLPDTSAYIATAGGTNTIRFKGDSGSATDGGAINTLTAAEIAVATNKGWTVTLV